MEGEGGGGDSGDEDIVAGMKGRVEEGRGGGEGWGRDLCKLCVASDPEGLKVDSAWTYGWELKGKGGREGGGAWEGGGTG